MVRFEPMTFSLGGFVDDRVDRHLDGKYKTALETHSITLWRQSI